MFKYAALAGLATVSAQQFFYEDDEIMALESSDDIDMLLDLEDAEDLMLMPGIRLNRQQKEALSRVSSPEDRAAIIDMLSEGIDCLCDFTAAVADTETAKKFKNIKEVKDAAFHIVKFADANGGSCFPGRPNWGPGQSLVKQRKRDWFKNVFAGCMGGTEVADPAEIRELRREFLDGLQASGSAPSRSSRPSRSAPPAKKAEKAVELSITIDPEMAGKTFKLTLTPETVKKAVKAIKKEAKKPAPPAYPWMVAAPKKEEKKPAPPAYPWMVAAPPKKEAPKAPVYPWMKAAPAAKPAVPKHCFTADCKYHAGQITHGMYGLF